ncbi:MAG TPA: hypothetical protein VMM12_14040 [Longimicrobiales bacterium]|nr:hypothetical protein [Longimicrobiales bacterium]
MRRPLHVLPLLVLAACDLGLGTGPVELKLDDLAEPESNTAVVALTKTIGDGIGLNDMVAQTQYLLTLRTPPPLPELLFDARSSVLRLTLAGIDETGIRVTGTDGVDVVFAAPDGVLFGPSTTCRITITSAWAPQPGARLRGKSDCPITDGTRELRVLFKFDYTVPAG